jgi:uncharacterized repeat protein (TIGR03803 family)
MPLLPQLGPKSFQVEYPLMRTTLLVLLLSIVATGQTQLTHETVLYSFGGGTDGAHPYAGLVQDSAGNFYGTTYMGGGSGCSGGDGCGTVFELTATGNEIVLYRFMGGADGANPNAGLVRDAAGNLYGTTVLGGTLNLGTVFQLTPSGAETVLYSFTGGTDGDGPAGGLKRDTTGNLYGTTQGGGDGTGCSFLSLQGCGTVFKVTPSGQETVLYRFNGGSDGGLPSAGPVLVGAGNLYGTTEAGGGNGCGGTGCGTIFRVSVTGKEAALYSFTGGSDGRSPVATLLRDTSGNLYGTTFGGGISGGCGGEGCGVVFEISAQGKEATLYSFVGGPDGQGPGAGLVRDAKGNLYGTTSLGGGVGCFGSGCGTVFKVNAQGNETVLYSFIGGTDGDRPEAPLLSERGKLYGTTINGGGTGCGGYGCGVVFEITP